MTSFQSLNLDPLLLKSLESEGYTTPTPIQAQAIPMLLEGRDLLGIAQTGTGKTAAFALPILHRLVANRKAPPRRGARALILSPTRELASQIAESFRNYGRHLGLSVTVVFGGVGHRPQANALQRGVDVLVATPGRLLDHVNERNISLETTEMFVLDEADQMLDLGFILPLRRIISQLPSRRQSMFFSATMPHEIGALASELLRDPAKVAVTPAAKTADRVAQKVIFVEAPKKRSLLVELFSDPAFSRTLVFTRTKRGADKVAKHLEDAGIPVAAIHGNKSQGQREAALGAFKSSRIRALIATDIAARGIDIDQVSHVINFELPNVPESYVHRIGRTARAGAEGIAISLCDGEERAYLKDIERLTRQTIPSEDRRGDSTLQAVVQAPKGPAAGRDRGSRPSHGQQPRRARHESAGRHHAPYQERRTSGGNPQAAQDRPDRKATFATKPHHARPHRAPANPHSDDRPGSQSLSHYRRERDKHQQSHRSGEHSTSAHLEGVGFLKPNRNAHRGGPDRQGAHAHGRPQGRPHGRPDGSRNRHQGHHGSGGRRDAARD